MKRKAGIIAITVILVMSLFTGCGNKVEEEVPYNYDLSEYVEVADYKDMPYMNVAAEVTDEEVEDAIQNELQYAASVVNATEGVVEDGDTINIAFAGRIDGELFDGGSSESYDLTVGTTSMIDGFVEGLIGKNVGETVTLDLMFPEDYRNSEVAGKPVTFDITINSKRIVSVPELTDEFVQANSEFQTVDEYRVGMKEILLKQKQDSLDSNVKDSLWQVIMTGSSAVKYPEIEMADANQAADDMETEYKAQATLYGWEWSDYLNTFMGTDEDGFTELKKEYAESLVLSNMVMYKLARDENITVSNKEFEDRAKEILKDSGFTEESFQSSYGMTIMEYAEQNGWRDSFLLDKVLDKVIEYGHEVSEDEFNDYVKSALGTDEESESSEDSESEEGEDSEESDDASQEETSDEATEDTSEETSDATSEDGSDD